MGLTNILYHFSVHLSILTKLFLMVKIVGIEYLNDSFVLFSSHVAGAAAKVDGMICSSDMGCDIDFTHI